MTREARGECQRIVNSRAPESATEYKRNDSLPCPRADRPKALARAPLAGAFPWRSCRGPRVDYGHTVPGRSQRNHRGDMRLSYRSSSAGRTVAVGGWRLMSLISRSRGRFSGKDFFSAPSSTVRLTISQCRSVARRMTKRIVPSLEKAKAAAPKNTAQSRGGEGPDSRRRRSQDRERSNGHWSHARSE